MLELVLTTSWQGWGMGAQRCCKVAIGDARASQVGQGAAQKMNTESEGQRGQSKLGEDAVSIATRWRWASQSRWVPQWTRLGWGELTVGGYAGGEGDLAHRAQTLAVLCTREDGRVQTMAVPGRPGSRHDQEHGERTYLLFRTRIQLPRGDLPPHSWPCQVDFNLMPGFEDVLPSTCILFLRPWTALNGWMSTAGEVGEC